ncbi:hypothetical protein ACHAXT_002729 [Thalassiosira profunda]
MSLLPKSLLLLSLPRAAAGFVARQPLARHASSAASFNVKGASSSSPLGQPALHSEFDFGLGAVDPSSSLTISQLSQLSASVDPLLIQHMATGGALALAGDVIAQSLLSESKEKKIPPKDWDVVRTAAFVAFGTLYTGGAQHFIFGFLNENFDAPMVRLALAQFFFIPFCYYPTFLAMVPALRAGWEAEEGFGSKEANARTKELFSETASRIPSTLLRNWCFWLPVQFVQFNFIPMDFHVTFTAAFGVVWNAILSWSTASTGADTDAPEKEASVNEGEL